jgi:hypothetical protein
MLKFFNQLFPVPGLNSGHCVPRVFFLLTNKLQTSYEDVFRYTIAEATKLGVNVFVTTSYADFVRAMHSALTTVWPSCEVKARRVHFGQCCWRTMQSLGLSQQYGEEYSEVSLFLKKVFGLLLVPPTKFSGYYAFDFTSSLSNYRRVTI